MSRSVVAPASHSECLFASAKHLLASVRCVLQLLAVTLREIFDENAYDRFLARSGMPPSRAAYRAFWEETKRARERRVRCC